MWSMTAACHNLDALSVRGRQRVGGGAYALRSPGQLGFKEGL
jgi:hypothetical protein